MNTRQQTVRKSAHFQGVGVHSGETVNLTFVPAPEDSGIKFQRVDLPGQPVIEANVDNVVDVTRSTTLGIGDAKVQTVEHVMSALSGLQIDNVLIQLDGPEVPILDGSAAMFVERLQENGVAIQNALRDYAEFSSEVSYEEPGRKVKLTAQPSQDLQLDVDISFEGQQSFAQSASLDNIDKFKKEISKSRTFCFFREVEPLLEQNLIKGGDLDNAIVIMDGDVPPPELQRIGRIFNRPDIKVQKDGILNNIELHYSNEPARHKLLDLIGDLALVGKPLRAHIIAERPGHAANIEFARKLKKQMKKSSAPAYDPSRPAVKDVNNIMEMLPHRYPFLMIDKVFHLDDRVVCAVKNITINEPIFSGHFPGNPIFPGVLQVEAMVQTGGILVLSTVPDPWNYWTYFIGIDKCRFRRKVVPGEALVLKCELDGEIRRGIAKMYCHGFVAGQVVCEAYLTAQIAKKDQ